MKNVILFDRQNMYALRGICMMLIIVHHIYLFLFCKIQANVPYSNIMLSLGYLSTGVFFLLSGYGLTTSICNHQPISYNYCITRLRKILHTFVFCFILSYLLIILLGNDISWGVLFNFITLSMPNSPTWFLKTIFSVYLIYYALSYFIQDMKKVIVILSIICLIWCVLAKHYFELPNYYYLTILNFPLGSLFAYTLKNKEISLKIAILFLLSAFAIFCILFFRGKGILTSLTFSVAVIILFSLLKINSSILNYVGVNSLVFYLGQTIPLSIYMYINIIKWNIISFTIFVIAITCISVLAYNMFCRFPIFYRFNNKA